MAINLSPLFTYGGTKEGKKVSRKLQKEIRVINKANAELTKDIAKSISVLTPTQQKDVLGAISKNIRKDVKRLMK